MCKHAGEAVPLCLLLLLLEIAMAIYGILLAVYGTLLVHTMTFVSVYSLFTY